MRAANAAELAEQQIVNDLGLGGESTFFAVRDAAAVGKEGKREEAGQ